VVVIPSFRTMASIAGDVLKSGGQPPPPDLMKYAKRAMISSMTATVLLLAIVMKVAAGFY